MRTATLLTLVLVCGSPAAAQDTLMVRADGPPAWGPRPRLVEEIRLGGIDGDPTRLFGRVSDVAVGQDDVLWVADSQARELRLFDDRGRLQRVAGREGEGPGEFKDPARIASLADGGMAVWDPGMFRVSLFNPDGSFLESYRVPATAVVGAPGNFQAGRDRDVFVLQLGKPPGAPDNHFVWLHLSEEGAVLDTLVGRPSRREGPIEYPIRNVAAVSPDGYLVEGRTDRWALTRPLADGRILRVEREVDPVAFAWAERREARAREEFFAVKRWGIEPQPVPREKPVFSELFVDEEARVWVKLHADAIRVPPTEGEKAELERAQALFGADDAPPPREWRERAVYDVVEPDGRFLGRVEIPFWNSRLVAARGRRLWVIQTGELGEHYVVQYLVEPGR